MAVIFIWMTILAAYLAVTIGFAKRFWFSAELVSLTIVALGGTIGAIFGRPAHGVACALAVLGLVFAALFVVEIFHPTIR